MDLAALDNKHLIGLASAVGGALLTLVTQQILTKSGLFTYSVLHSRVGVSADDAVFGSVRVTWNNNTIANLYSSTVELTSRSMRDYEDVVVRVFTNDISLLTERTEIVGTTHILKWTEEFSAQLRVAPGQQFSEAQLQSVLHQRDYLVQRSIGAKWSAFISSMLQRLKTNLLFGLTSCIRE